MFTWTTNVWNRHGYPKIHTHSLAVYYQYNSTTRTQVERSHGKRTDKATAFKPYTGPPNLRDGELPSTKTPQNPESLVGWWWWGEPDGYLIKVDWRHKWNMSPIHQHDITDPTLALPGFDLNRSTWSNLNRIKTSMQKAMPWCISGDSPACDCGADEQTVEHIVRKCPLRKYMGPFRDIINARPSALAAFPGCRALTEVLIISAVANFYLLFFLTYLHVCFSFLFFNFCDML